MVALRPRWFVHHRVCQCYVLRSLYFFRDTETTFAEMMLIMSAKITFYISAVFSRVEDCCSEALQFHDAAMRV